MVHQPTNFALLLGALILSSCSNPQKVSNSVCNLKSANSYLEQRESWWVGWPVAARDHDTFCISCHTVVPFMIARSLDQRRGPDEKPSNYEQIVLDNVKKRVRLWQEVSPYYDEADGAGKSAESRGTEAVLNTLVLSCYDAQSGRLADDTKTAFGNMWALQQTDGENRGSWPWLDFGLKPWEAAESRYFGATLAALAVGLAPEHYRSSPEIQDNLKRLRFYLRQEYPRQALFGQTYLLLGSTKWPDLLDASQRESIKNAILSKQRTDGGWSLSTLEHNWSGSSLKTYMLSWIRRDGTIVDTGSDGYATALSVLVLLQSGMTPKDTPVTKGLQWLTSHQTGPDGSWTSFSLNKSRKLNSNVGRFMSDAATAYAVLDLSEANRLDARVADKSGL